MVLKNIRIQTNKLVLSRIHCKDFDDDLKAELQTDCKDWFEFILHNQLKIPLEVIRENNITMVSVRGEVNLL